MNRKGFTLLELMGVVIILGVLAYVSFPMVLEQTRKSKQGIKDSTKMLIIDAAKDYYEDNINNYDEAEGLTYCVDVATLIDSNYLNGKIKNESFNDLSTNKFVKFIYHNGQFDFDIVDSCQNGVLSVHNVEVPVVSENSGLYKSDIDSDRFIYRGGNPVNNWIELNEGTDESPNMVEYRIVSFEDDGTIKVVRNSSIGRMSWDDATARQNTNGGYCTSDSGCNVWGSQSSTLYNGLSLGDDFHYSYYASNMISSLTEGNIGKVDTESALNIFLNHLGEGNYWEAGVALDRYIAQHEFFVNGVYYSDSYQYGDKGILMERTEEKMRSWIGKIGLMNITEYAQASLNQTCDIYSNYGYNSSNYYADAGNSNKSVHTPSGGWLCADSNWTFTDYAQWTISPCTFTTRYVWAVSSTGYFTDINARNAERAVRPTFYLKSNISLAGSGSESDPYRIVGVS